MKLQLSRENTPVTGELNITGSKSESNRMLILQALYPGITIRNLSNSDDSEVLKKALTIHEGVVDIHHAGTAMRFLTAYFASRPDKEVELTGSKRMQERPVALLVDALRDLGADIEYVKNEGFPPLRIKGKKLERNTVELKANISSQYISALMLIAPSLPNGLEINLKGKITSVPYIKMTLSLLKKIRFKGEFEENKISIEPAKKIDPVVFDVESDWSSASYFYSIAAISEISKIKLSNYKESSNQGDAVLSEIYEHFGVHTSFSAGGEITLSKSPGKRPGALSLDLTDSPDLAQTVAVTCFALGVPCDLSGLHTLKIKETDRLQALKNEIEKFGGKVEITDASLHLTPADSFKKDVAVETYNDHRMAMAFAPLAMKVPLQIKDSGVVSKSYPDFWNDLESLDFVVRQF